MENILQIDANFIDTNTVFTELVEELRSNFSKQNMIVPMRHHHDFPNSEMHVDSTLLLMPAWNPGENAGVKVITVSPKNSQFKMPSIQGVYIYFDALKGHVKAILEAKSLTAKRTAAASALASSFLSRKNASSLLMIGTGALSTNLIKAHAAVRPINTVYIWGRNFNKAKAIAAELKEESFIVTAIESIEEKIRQVDIISCATLSKTPLILGANLQEGQHIDLVGAYKKDMRESDNATISRASVYVDTFQGTLKEGGDIVIPIQNGTLKKENIKADLFELCSSQKTGRASEKEITLFKSVGHALEDLTAAAYYFDKFKNK